MECAATYARASSEHQRYSVANQTAALRDYALAHDFDVVRAYEDDGRSGLDIRGRPGLRSLIQQVVEPSCPFHTLLVYDVSRWGPGLRTDGQTASGGSNCGRTSCS